MHLLLVKTHLSHSYEITFGEKIRKQPSQDEVLLKSSKFRKQIICAFYWSYPEYEKYWWKTFIKASTLSWFLWRTLHRPGTAPGWWMVKDAWQASSLFVNLNCSCSLTLEAIFKDSGRQKDSTAFLKVIQVVLGLGWASEELRREHKLRVTPHCAWEKLLRPNRVKSDSSEEISRMIM